MTQQDQNLKISVKNRKDAKILVVEDTYIHQLVMKEFLKSLRFTNFVIATTGKGAISAYERGKFDIVLLDCGLPDISGFSVCTAIKDIDKRRGEFTPVIAITATCSKEQEVKEAGFDQYCIKPVDKYDLDRIIIYWLNRSLILNNREGAKYG